MFLEVFEDFLYSAKFIEIFHHYVQLIQLGPRSGNGYFLN
jgi:hypothetical protein